MSTRVTQEALFGNRMRKETDKTVLVSQFVHHKHVGCGTSQNIYFKKCMKKVSCTRGTGGGELVSGRQESWNISVTNEARGGAKGTLGIISGMPILRNHFCS